MSFKNAPIGISFYISFSADRFFMKRHFLYFLLMIMICTSVRSNITLPSIFGDHMVLQQNSEIWIWGWAKTLEPLQVICSWHNDTIEVIADQHANWKVKVLTPAAGGPYSIELIGYNRILLDDVMIGEVWLCAGQSNMEWTPSAGISNAEDDIRTADQPHIRFFKVSHQTALTPQNDIRGSWQICTPETMKNFSAVGYYFGKKIFENLTVPIGLIESTWGGTPAEAWMQESIIQNDPVLLDASKKLVQEPWGPIQAGLIYNAMIYPLSKTLIAGTLWYQGEANVRNASTYGHLFSTLIINWRELWGYDFPFYYVQIAPFHYSQGIEGVLIQDAQRKVLDLPRTGMVVTNDIGNPHDIHPTKKKQVGERLALWALHNSYQMDIDYSGPLYSFMTKENKSIRLHFNHTGNQLISTKNVIDDFIIAGSNKKFYPAKAVIDRNTIIVSSDKVKNPVAVRFAWMNGAEPGLFNPAGLPASCFRTDNWKIKGY